MLEAGRSDFRIDPFIHMPAALPFPIGNRLYDWKYETEPEPDMKGRRVYHARGKVLGGSSSINGMIFQRGNPMDYERWAADRAWRTGTTCTACRTSSGWRRCLAGAPTPGAAATARWCSSAGRPTNPLFGAFFEAAQQAGYPLTDDVNGYRQEGFAKFDRNVHRGRRLSAARAYLHPVMDRKNLKVETLALATKVRFEGKRAVGVDYLRGGRLHAHASTAGEVILCGGAINTPQLLQLSGVGDPSTCSRSASTSCTTCPASARTSRTTSRSTSSTPPSSRSRSRPACAGAAGPASATSGCSTASGLGATNHFEGGGFARSNEDVDYPNLMFHFLPVAIRYDGSAPDRGPRLPGAHRPDVRRHPRLGADHESPTRSSTRRCCSTTSRRRTTASASGSRRSGSPATSSTSRLRAVQRRRAVARTRGRDRRGDPRLGGAGRRDRAAPLVHGEDGRRRDVGRRPDHR